LSRHSPYPPCLVGPEGFLNRGAYFGFLGPFSPFLTRHTGLTALAVESSRSLARAPRALRDRSIARAPRSLCENARYAAAGGAVRPHHSRLRRPPQFAKKRDLIPMGLARVAPPDREPPAQRAWTPPSPPRSVPPALRAHARSARPSLHETRRKIFVAHWLTGPAETRRESNLTSGRSLSLYSRSLTIRTS
jgi:hypothetical protein